MSQAKKENKFKVTFLRLLFGLAIGLSLIQLVISHRLAVAGETVRVLEAKALALEKENRLLEEEVSHVGSLSNLSLRAQELGLQKVDDVLRLTPEVPVAYQLNP